MQQTFPDDIWNLIISIKKEFEKRDAYILDLRVFASAITYKPSLKSITVTEARQSFVRVFPKHHEFLKMVGRDLEKFLGPCTKINNLRIWFLFTNYSYIAPIYGLDLTDHLEEPPERTV